MRALLPVLAAIVMSVTPVTLRAGDGQGVPGSFEFRPNQSVYVVAFHYEDAHAGRDTGRPLIGEYLSAEQLIRKEFAEARTYRPVDRSSEADYVFMVYVHDGSAEALAIAPDRYRQFKEDVLRGDLDRLRDVAYGRYVVGPLKVPTVGRLTERLVRTFHDQETSSRSRP